MGAMLERASEAERVAALEATVGTLGRQLGDARAELAEADDLLERLCLFLDRQGERVGRLKRALRSQIARADRLQAELAAKG